MGGVSQALRVLLVDDSVDDADLLRRELVRGGLVVETERVDTAADFTAALDAGSWDVVLSDFSMPGFGGRQALDIVKARALDIPFLFVSGTMGEDVAVEAMRAGASDYFSKGNTTRLVAAIERELREAKARREREADQRRAEDERERLVAELQTALKARDDFLSIASHELKTPLTSLQLQVQGLARLCTRDPSGAIPVASFEARARSMARQIQRLNALIGSLLDVTRIASGNIPLFNEAVALHEVVADAVEACNHLLEPSDVEVVVHADPVTGHWDRLRVETIVVSLLSNAMKFAGGKPVEVTLSRAGTCARLTVTDHGMGIPREEQARIFEKFERAVPKQHYGGLGLGLWVARQLAMAHGGSIHVESEEGRGSTFAVELPLQAEGAS
jgi:signal transduction histidine kinase